METSFEKESLPTSPLPTSPSRRGRRGPQSRPTVRLGAWCITERIARGSCTDVFAARPVRATVDAPCDYVVKKLRREFAEDPIAIDTVQREAVAGRRLSHQHLISVLADHSQASPYYVVMPRLEGATVAQALSGVGRMSIPQALWVTRQVAEALANIHKRGMIHCDVKPANIFVAPYGHATLFDLGFVCKWKAGEAMSQAILRGTMAYIAPEMLTSSTAAGPWSDVYSLGVAMFEMLTGRLPFEHSSSARMAESHLRELPPSPRTFVPNISRSVAQLIERMLAKSPSRRPDDVVDQLRRLEIESFSLRAG